ncbi:MAG: prolyl oligopeptidase family serine peptidase [Rubripirellula sp.]
MRYRYVFTALLVLAGLSACPGEEPRVVREIEYASPGGEPLRLDLYLPSDATVSMPCVVFVHGGGWKGGDKKSAKKNAAWLTEYGFAVASINYRLTDVAQWPAQIDDCYAAVRWVRENGPEYGIATERVGAWGTSAGGHLVALMGTRNYPGEEDVSSRVQAVCDWFGPSELMSMPPNNVGQGRTAEDVAKSNGAKLLGTTVRDVPELARDASAIDHVSNESAQFLIMHGDSDPGVPLTQSTSLHAKLIRAGVPSQLKVIPDAGHGGPLFQTPDAKRTVLQFFQRSLEQPWNQGSGPDASFRTRTAAPPVKWSVVRGDGVKWRKKLPETGQSTVVTWGDRIFFTTMKEVDQDSETGADIVAWCCDAETGQTIWTQEISARYPLRLSGCFSDSSTPPAVTDGNSICFFNASGSIACFDWNGTLKWQRDLMAVGRSQPTIVNNTVVFTNQTYMPDEGGHFSHEHKDKPVDQWTQLRAIDLASGRDRWSTICGVNMGCVPLLQSRVDGRQVMVVGRGGGHSPPEKPEGVSMIDAKSGETLWSLPLKKFMSTMTYSLFGDDALVFDGGEHLWVDSVSGKVRKRVSIVEQVPVRTKVEDRWVTEVRDAPVRKPRSIIQQSNVLAGKYHYFRSYTEPWVGRVNVRSGGVEYLQLPVQLKAGESPQHDLLLWGPEDIDPLYVSELLGRKNKKLKTLPITDWTFALNDMRNSRCHVVMGDQRAMGNGWGHHASQVPSVVGDFLYVPTMSGTVYVLRWNADDLNENAIVAINDLGSVGRSWNRATLSYSRGHLYAHTIGEVLCIGE